MTITVEQRNLRLLAEIASYSSSRYEQPSMHDSAKAAEQGKTELEQKLNHKE